MHAENMQQAEEKQDEDDHMINCWDLLEEKDGMN